MADTTEEEHLDKLTNPKSESHSVEITPTKDTEIIEPKQETENMEVHHHPQVEKKNFKEYLLEGLMIFFAVMLGFFAENIRENITDNSKEKEYIISMIEDAKTDTANMRQAIELNNHRVTYLDSLAALCLNYDAHKNMDAKMYRLYRFGLIHPAFINPIERTIQQLKTKFIMPCWNYF